MNKLIVMVGYSGSGKTTWAHKHDDEYLVIDSDEMRLRLLGDAADQTQNARVFDEMFRITVNALRFGESVIYSATNLRAYLRAKLIRQIKRRVPGVEFICVIMNTPVEVCRERNSKRSRIVPAFVIDKQVREFQYPSYDEGWDSIIVME